MAVFTETITCKHGHTCSRTKDGSCSECRRVSRRKWREKNPGYARSWQVQNAERYRDTVRKTLYGLTSEATLQLFRAQDGKCPICFRAGHLGAKGDGAHGEVQLHVEHCHRTGVVRGLVCQRCNLLLSDHDSRLLQRAAAFVARFEVS